MKSNIKLGNIDTKINNVNDLRYIIMEQQQTEFYAKLYYIIT